MAVDKVSEIGDKVFHLRGDRFSEVTVYIVADYSSLDDALSYVPNVAEPIKKILENSNETLHVLNYFHDYRRIVVRIITKTDKMLSIGQELYSHHIGSEAYIATGYEDNTQLFELTGDLILGFRLSTYSFDKYKTIQKNKPAIKIHSSIEIIGSSKEQGSNNIGNVLNNSKSVLNDLDALFQGMVLTKDLVNEPANHLYSETFIDYLRSLADFGVVIKVYDEEALKKMNMEALLSVNQGSNRPARVIVMEWNGSSNPDAKPIAFVGKGVTFDSGGLSLKPPMAMFDMKKDMAGAATVSGVIKTLALRKAKVNAVGVIGLVENMVSGDSMRPGDIISSLSGKTIEVLNTDAEGRLVLADLLYYTQVKYKPEFMINIATLTGAIIMALGHKRAGIFCNNVDLEQQLRTCGDKVDELVWPFPVSSEYNDYLKSDVADLCNISKGPKGAGSIAAAMFLHEFIDGCKKWAHIDIAGMAFGGSTLSAKQGATGYGVKLLNQLSKDYYEE